jgi:hypothetical protein
VSTPGLLRAAAGALDEGTDPFATSWLVEHNVTLEQCFSLSELLAIGARIVAKGIEDPRSLQGQAMLMSLAENLT